MAWPRLYGVGVRWHQARLRELKVVADARAAVEFLLVLSLWCCGFAVASPIVLVGSDGSLGVASLLFAAGLTLAYLSYRAAVEATGEYSAYLWSTFELHRFVLLGRLRIPIPNRFDDERTIWANLCGFVLRGQPLPEEYDPGVSEQVIRIRGIQSGHGRR